MSRRILVGDTVAVMTGKDKGKSGTVLRIFPSRERIVVEGIAMRTKHVRKTPQSAGQRVQFEGTIHISNVQIVDPKTKKPTRVGFKVDGKGKKTRIAKASGESLPKRAVAKPDDKAPAKKKTASRSKTAAS